ncbi:MAG: hypothetical protein ACR2OV_12640 [Hyphomicrobiaceae bacterium]
MAEVRGTQDNFIGRVIDYMFGRNTLIGVASLMLLAISGYATWSGMNDFIVGVSTSPAAQGRQIPGGLSVSNEFLVIGVVVALTFLMWLSLRETFGARRSWRDRLITLPLYLFLALWSVGFGYGFWWSLIAGEEATRTSLSGLQEDARGAGTAVAARLDAVKAQLDNVVTWSESQMAREDASGGSCGVSSGAGRGPLYQARASVRDSVASLRESITTSWIAPVQLDIADLQKSVAGLEGSTVLERQQSFEAKAAEVRGKARSIAARSNEFGASTASEMRALATTVSIRPGKPGFSCYDPTLAQRLNQASEQAARPAVLKLREAAFNEGPAGVANAVKNLWANIGSVLVDVPSWFGATSGSEIADERKPITGRDLIALLATLGIDLGLFVLTALNPPREAPRQMLPAGIVRQVTAAINTAIKRAPGADMEWVRRHFIHHNKSSYLVIPNLFSCDPDDEDEASKALAMNQLAGVLDDLDLVRWPQKYPWWSVKRWTVGNELEDLKREEKGTSMTDMTDIRRERLAELEKSEGIALDKDKAERIRAAEPVRNHGLFSKAERVLTIAGWSENARRDIEVFKLVDTDGLTPLLAVLNNLGMTTDTEDEEEESTTS